MTARTRRGFTLMETVAAIVILAVALPPMLWAINEAEVFRFLTKPCSAKELGFCIEQAFGALEVGDLLLAGLSEPTSEAPTSMHRRPAGMVVVLPNDARALIE